MRVKRLPVRADETLPLMLTREETARQLSVGLGTVDKLLKVGLSGSLAGLRAVKLGTACRIPLTEVQDFIARQLSAQNGGAS